MKKLNEIYIESVISRHNKRYCTGGLKMKHGQRLLRRHKELLKRYRLNYENWLYTKELPGELHLVHRYSGKVRILKVG